jgi:hypothetical protein
MITQKDERDYFLIMQGFVITARYGSDMYHRWYDALPFHALAEYQREWAEIKERNDFRVEFFVHLRNHLEVMIREDTANRWPGLGIEKAWELALPADQLLPKFSPPKSKPYKTPAGRHSRLRQFDPWQVKFIEPGVSIALEDEFRFVHWN